MSKASHGPRKPATKFPHLQKRMQKNQTSSQIPLKPRDLPPGKKGGR